MRGMDIVKGKWKKNLISKALEGWRSLGDRSKKFLERAPNSLTKSKSWHCTTTSSEEEKKRKTKCQLVAPEGCFSVYVGSQKQRFVVKTKFAHHPLFVMLLDDAVLEYGYNSEGPILLPCDVDLFYKVLAEMDSSDAISCSPRRSFANSYGSLIPRSPAHRPKISIDRGYGSYKILKSPSQMLSMN
ncbi:Indole-3-acetic acid-induced protein ARG7 [Morella rubra]|uniref:Indole-3-acetic acid-induced protein ARG7 n=1 Tax=Morella rubra TaxID=262757 RepID=A0A6A1VX27_9ROSI|nr:Indole-3-acetic acid-induced protein ARG7 [Morella rubra]